MHQTAKCTRIQQLPNCYNPVAFIFLYICHAALHTLFHPFNTLFPLKSTISTELSTGFVRKSRVFGGFRPAYPHRIRLCRKSSTDFGIFLSNLSHDIGLIMTKLSSNARTPPEIGWKRRRFVPLFTQKLLFHTRFSPPTVRSWRGEYYKSVDCISFLCMRKLEFRLTIPD